LVHSCTIMVQLKLHSLPIYPPIPTLLSYPNCPLTTPNMQPPLLAAARPACAPLCQPPSSFLLPPPFLLLLFLLLSSSCRLLLLSSSCRLLLASPSCCPPPSLFCPSVWCSKWQQKCHSVAPHRGPQTGGCMRTAAALHWGGVGGAGASGGAPARARRQRRWAARVAPVGVCGGLGRLRRFSGAFFP
jgi:hypothetical protein